MSNSFPQELINKMEEGLDTNAKFHAEIVEAVITRPWVWDFYVTMDLDFENVSLHFSRDDKGSYYAKFEGQKLYFKKLFDFSDDDMVDLERTLVLGAAA